MSKRDGLTTERPGEIDNRGLSQAERIVNIFIAPSKTFTDVLRSQSWWMPFLILTIVSYLFSGITIWKMGDDQLYESVIKENPKTAEQVASASPEVQAQARKITLLSVKGAFLIAPLLILGVAMLTALVLWGSLKFLLNGKPTFGVLYTVSIYATLISIPRTLIAVVVLLMSKDLESFHLKNPVGTNIGFYLPLDTTPWLKSLMDSLDFITIWYLAVLAIGCCIVAKVKRGPAAAVVFGWWTLMVLISMGWAALSS